MTLSTTARLTILLGDAQREVYRIHRGALTAAELPQPGGKPLDVNPTCIRCGTMVSAHGLGRYGARTLLVRDVGTRYRHVAVKTIHHGCIPAADGDIQRIRARALRSSQVRA